MTQSTIQMVNETGLDFRLHLNAGLESLATDFAGPLAPVEYVPYSTWLDTSYDPPILKRRSGDNSTWDAPFVADTVSTFDTISSLRGNAGIHISTVKTLGYWSKGDTGGAVYYKDSADVVSADNGGDVIVDAAGTRWKLETRGLGISVKQFGAKCDSSVVGGGTEEAARIQAAVTYAAGRFPVYLSGFSLVGTTINCPTDTMLYGMGKDRSGLVRTATHIGNTLNIGVATPGLHAGAYEIKHLWLRRHITFNGGAAYNPGVSSTVDNRLTGDQSHIYAENGQRAVIEDCTIDNMPYNIVLSGGSTTDLLRNHLGGSINDHTIAGLQEGLALVWYKIAYDGTCPTEMTSRGNDMIGGFGSAVRDVTLGTVTPAISENVGQKWALRIDAMEGYASHGDYMGGQNEYTIFFNPSSGKICSNIKFNGAFFDGSRQAVVRFDQNDAAGVTNLVNFSDCIFNGEIVSKSAITSGSAYSAVTAYDVTVSDCKFMAFLTAPVVSFSIVGLHISDATFNGYHSYGGFTGNPQGSAAVYVAGAEYSDKVTFANLRVGGSTNNLSDTNNCQYGVYCGGTFPHEPLATGTINMGLGLAGGALTVGTQRDKKLPALINGWTNLGGGFDTAGYSKDDNGTVFLAGIITSGTINTSAFALPIGYRPSLSKNFSTVSADSFGFIRVDSAGAVVIAGGNNSWVSLDGISFQSA